MLRNLCCSQITNSMYDIDKYIKEELKWPSNIISETIDGTYPVAGVDNDTQGFRDNFTIIKTGLATAQSEITSLYRVILLN
jgi:hypothetical protein